MTGPKHASVKIDRMTINAERIHTPKIAELIVAAIRDGIEAGKFHEGDTLPRERDLAEIFGTSRPSVREALRILEAEQLVTIRRGATGGPVVTTPAPEAQASRQATGLLMRDLSAAHVAQAREAAEIATLRSLAPFPEPEILADLAQSANAPGADFHHEIVRAGGNPALVSLVETLAQAVRISPRLARELPRCADGAFHQKTFRLVARGVGDQAATGWAAHVAALRGAG